MIAASHPVQRPADARVMTLDASGAIAHRARRDFPALLRRGDLLVANDAATLPASLHGRHASSGAPVEVRIAARASIAPGAIERVTAIVFGSGDYRTRTEDRPLPPALEPGDRLELGPLVARVEAVLGHPRLVALRFEGTPAAIWSGIARHGRPVQYAHVPEPLQMWDVWTPIAGAPVALEAPSAGFAIDWRTLAELREHGIGFVTLTHAAGLSSTGDAALDTLLPLDEPYEIPAVTARAIAAARRRGGRIVAVGTTVVRALEHAASRDGRVRAGRGVATQRLGAQSCLRVVDAMLTGTHEPGTSHHALLQAFADEAALHRADDELERAGYRTHEFGDSVLIEEQRAKACGCDKVSRWHPSSPSPR